MFQAVAHSLDEEARHAAQRQVHDEAEGEGSVILVSQGDDTGATIPSDSEGTQNGSDSMSFRRSPYFMSWSISLSQ